MLDIGWSEMLVVGVVALIVVGPKDLPKMFHTLGEFTGKAKGMAREFQRAMDVAAKEAGVNDLVKDFKRTASGQSIKEATGFDDIEKEFRDVGRNGKAAPKAQTKANAKPGMTPVQVEPVAKPVDVEPDETSADEFEAQSHDADLAARNAAASATEAERIKRAKKAEAARLKAAELRARREAETAAAEPVRSEPARPEPSSETES